MYDFSPDIEIGQPSVLKEGKDGAIIATGIYLGLGMEIIEKLKEKGYNFKLISLHTLKPINREVLLKELKGKKAVFTLEEHNIIGGLGSAVAEILAESDWQGQFKRIAIPDKYPSEVGKAEYLRQSFGLVKEEIAEEIVKDLKKY